MGDDHDPQGVRFILLGAVARMRAAGVAPDFEGCECSDRADRAASWREPWPAPEGDGRPWCILCAIDSETSAAGYDGDYFGHCLGAVASVVAERPFSLEQWRERDDVLLPWSEGSSAAEIIATFERAAA